MLSGNKHEIWELSHILSPNSPLLRHCSDTRIVKLRVLVSMKHSFVMRKRNASGFWYWNTHTHTQTEQSLPLHSLFSPLLILQSPSAWLSMESPWGPSKAAWMGSWAPCSRCLCLSRGWSRWTQRALPTSAILCSSWVVELLHLSAASIVPSEF